MTYLKMYDNGEIIEFNDKNEPISKETCNIGNGREVLLAANVLKKFANTSRLLSFAAPEEFPPQFDQKGEWHKIAHSYRNGGDESKPPQIYYADGGYIRFVSDGDVDADGSPRAAEIDPGNGQLQTSLGKRNGWKGGTDYVNSEEIPYFVLPMNWVLTGAGDPRLGDIAKVSTKKGDYVFAILADKGPNDLLGEVSIRTVEALGFDPWKNGKIVRGAPMGLVYEIIPNSANLERCRSYQDIQNYGAEMWQKSAFPAFEAKELPPGTNEVPSIIPFATQYTPQMTTHGAYPEGLRGAVVHFTAGKAGTGVLEYGRQQGFAFLYIDRDGTLYQAHNILEWGYHAGVSAHPKLKGGVTDDLIGIEICSAGRLRKVIGPSNINGNKYAPWYAIKTGAPSSGDIDPKWVDESQCISQQEVRFEPSTDEDSVAGYYHIFTSAQEVTLFQLLVWLKNNIPTFDVDMIFSHYEVAKPVGRKNDISGALSMQMPELRARVKAMS